MINYFNSRYMRNNPHHSMSTITLRDAALLSSQVSYQNHQTIHTLILMTITAQLSKESLSTIALFRTTLMHSDDRP